MLPKTILLVEDTEADKELIETVLARVLPAPLPRIDHCSTLAETRDYLATTPVDLVILDLGLPDSPTPAATLDAVSKIIPLPKILIMSGHISDLIADEAARAGIPVIGKDEITNTDFLIRTIDEVLQ